MFWQIIKSTGILWHVRFIFHDETPFKHLNLLQF